MIDSYRSEVLKILQECPDARKSDDFLVKEFTKRNCKQEVDLKALGICFAVLKTLERDRRWIQAHNIDLRDSVITGLRSSKEEEFRCEYG